MVRILALAAILAAVGCATRKPRPVSEPASRATPKKGRELDPDVYPALAPTDENMREAFEALRLGEYGKVIGYFKGAYHLKPDPALLFNIAQAYQKDGNCRAAFLYYERYLQVAPEGRYARKVTHRMDELGPKCK